MVNNNLPRYWICQNDGSQLYKSNVINYLNKVYNQEWQGTYSGDYYGFDGSNEYNGTYTSSWLSSFKNNPVILTLEEFIKLTTKTKTNTYELWN